MTSATPSTSWAISSSALPRRSSPALFQGRWGLRSAARTVGFFSELLLGGDLLEAERRLAMAVYDAGEDNPMAATVAFLMSLPGFQQQ